MIGEILGWIVANWGAITTVIGLVAGAVTTWAVKAHETKKTLDAKEVAIKLVENELPRAEAEKYVNQQIALQAQARVAQKRQRDETIRRERAKWRQKADEQLRR